MVWDVFRAIETESVLIGYARASRTGEPHAVG